MGQWDRGSCGRNVEAVFGKGNAEENVFKMYMFVSMLENGTRYEILQGKLFGYKGAVFENRIADIFSKMGRKLYYFYKDSGLEVAFVTR